MVYFVKMKGIGGISDAKNYKISIPITVHERFCKEEVLAAMKECGAERIFLSAGVLSLDGEKHGRIMERMKEYVPYFQANGLEVGSWFWSFWRSGIPAEELEDYLIVNMEGNPRVSGESLEGGVKEDAGRCCPASEKFIASAMETVAELAAVGPDILMLDDDYRFGFHDLDLGGHGFRVPVDGVCNELVAFPDAL